MSKCIYICSKKKLSPSVKNKLNEICKKIAPDNINPSPSRIMVNGNVAYAILNPANTLLINGNNLLMGKIIGDNTNWDVPLHDPPDGSFAAFRDGKDFLEIVTDPVASRTVWYYMNNEIFISSTSQRAIILFIGGFEFNEKVIPWMLTNGSLGPSFSWDKRINCVPPDSSVILNKNSWSINIKTNPIEFKEFKDTDKNHEKKLSDVLNSTFKSLLLNYSDWALTLSGGYDSRGILCLVFNSKSKTERIKSITWGLESSLTIADNDAYIAQKLASEFNLVHNYLHTDLSFEPVEQIINRFLLNSEGRTDQLSGYMDGFKIWKTLFEEGFHGIIRGDEGFGCNQYSSVKIARMNQGCALYSDYSNLKDFRKFGLPIQELPPHLEQKAHESLSAYRDRLFHEHDLPTNFSALSDLKLSYVEVINPFLSRKILQQVRQLPDHLRTGKALFKKIVLALSPNIDFANSRADSSPENILTQKQFVELLTIELSSKSAKSIFQKEFLDFVLNGLKTENRIKQINANSFFIKVIIKKIVPRFIKNILREKHILHSVDPNILAFRVFIISRMNMILTEDSNNDIV